MSHETLVKKLEVYGFEESSRQWMKSYLDNRYQSVTIQGKTSSLKEMKLGTPQGSR